MSNSYIQIPTDSVGKKLRTRTMIEDTQEVYDEIVRLSNSTDTVIDPATETKQDDVIAGIQSLVGFEIPAYDEINLTYVASGNGAGEIETVIYKAGGDTVATLTLSYDADNNIISIIKT